MTDLIKLDSWNIIIIIIREKKSYVNRNYIYEC